MKRELLSIGIAERLKDLRENRKLSHQKLADILDGKAKKGLSRDSLINYEISEPYNSKALSNLGMNIEALCALADFYGVSTDYILGRDDLKISDKAKRNLSLIANTPYKATLDAFLSSREFETLIERIGWNRHVNQNTVNDILSKPNDCDITVIGTLEYEARHAFRDLSDDFADNFSSLSGYDEVLDALETKKNLLQQIEEEDHAD